MVKTVLLFVYVAVSMIFLVPFGLIALIFYAIGFRKAMKQVFYRIAQGWGLAIIKVTGCKVTVTGRENIPKNGGVCFVSNHSGYFDIVLMLAYTGRMVGFVAKKEFLLVPFLNIWIFMLGGFFIDRSSLRKASQTINKGVEKIKSGHGLIIFPEGTTVTAWFDSGNVDMPPAGDIPGMFRTILMFNTPAEIVIRRKRKTEEKDDEYEVRKSELAEALGGLEDAGTLVLLDQYLRSIENSEE
jgi:1-acyl-sn-glycerol-3-phosphate acyltransferase